MSELPPASQDELRRTSQYASEILPRFGCLMADVDPATLPKFGNYPITGYADIIYGFGTAVSKLWEVDIDAAQKLTLPTSFGYRAEFTFQGAYYEEQTVEDILAVYESPEEAFVGDHFALTIDHADGRLETETRYDIRYDPATKLYVGSFMEPDDLTNESLGVKYELSERDCDGLYSYLGKLSLLENYLAV